MGVVRYPNDQKEAGPPSLPLCCYYFGEVRSGNRVDRNQLRRFGFEQRDLQYAVFHSRRGVVRVHLNRQIDIPEELVVAALGVERLLSFLFLVIVGLARNEQASWFHTNFKVFVGEAGDFGGD